MISPIVTSSRIPLCPISHFSISAEKNITLLSQIKHYLHALALYFGLIHWEDTLTRSNGLQNVRTGNFEPPGLLQASPTLATLTGQKVGKHLVIVLEFRSWCSWTKNELDGWILVNSCSVLSFFLLFLCFSSHFSTVFFPFVLYSLSSLLNSLHASPLSSWECNFGVCVLQCSKSR